MPELIKPLLAVRLYSSRQAQDSGKQGVFHQIPLGSNVELTDDPCRLQGFSQVMCDGRLYATFADSLHDSVAASVMPDTVKVGGRTRPFHGKAHSNARRRSTASRSRAAKTGGPLPCTN